MFIITIDTGTTNTRATLWKDRQAVCSVKKEVGVRMTSIDKSNQKLLEAVRECKEAVLSQAGIAETQLESILATGMISSELGAYEIERVPAPVSAAALAACCQAVKVPEISTIHPIWFVPGVRNQGDSVDVRNCEQMDVMRGEEVEAFGILERTGIEGPVILVLPGSHTKYVYMNSNNEIVGCVTTMAGELTMLLTRSSIISSSLDAAFADSIEESWLEAGADNCDATGLARAAFSVRILDLFAEATVNQKANYLLGIILAEDIRALFNSSVYKPEADCRIVVAGTTAYARGIAHLIARRADFSGQVRVLEAETMQNLAGCGAMTVMALKK